MSSLPSPVATAPRLAVPQLDAGVRLASAVLALVCAALGLSIAAAHPLGPAFALAAFVAWVGLAAWRRSLAFGGLFALLPVVGLATLSGWLVFEETDLLVLATAAGGFAAAALGWADGIDAAPRRDRPRLSALAVTMLALYLVATVASIARGVDAAGGWRFDWFATYNDALNSVRVGKSFVWALLLTPLVVRLSRMPRGFDSISAGMTIGLGLCSLLVIRERAAFVGLLDFSEDYRATGPFWENHVGGVALEGYLALAIPFAVRDMVRPAADPSGRARAAVAGCVFAMAIYACIATFTRGLYAAVPLSLALMAVLVVRQRLQAERRLLWRRLGRGAVFVAICGVAGFEVFQHGGYRTLLATFLVAASWMPAEPALRRANGATFAAALAIAVVAGAVGYAACAVMPRLTYVFFAVTFCGVVAACVSDARRPSATVATAVIAAWWSLAMAAVLVASHWGGSRAGAEATIALAAIAVLAFATSRLKDALWPPRPQERLITVVIAAGVMGFVAVFLGGSYMAGRMGDSTAGLSGRVVHWRAGVGRLNGPADWMLGKGFGRFPSLSLNDAIDTEAPGSYRFVRRAGERFVQVSSPHFKFLNFEAIFRFSQRVAVKPGSRYLLVASVRTQVETSLDVEVCEKQLIYSMNCAAAEARLKPEGPAWHEVRLPLITKDFNRGAWYAERPVFFAVGLTEPGRTVDIRSLHLIGPDGVDLLANGDFADETAHWFSSSERHHLPFRIENMVFNVLTDQGLVGLALFALLVSGALLRVVLGRAMRHPDAPCIAAVIVGGLGVGVFDSLVDVPRVTLIFYLAVIIGLALRSPRVEAKRFASPAPVPIAPVASPSDAEERARRRQRAFGERRPG